MSEDTPLIASEKATPTAGTGAIDSINSTWTALDSGNWTEGLVGSTTAISSFGAMMTDPLAALATAGFGWAMEHVGFLKEPLDALTGDQQALEAMSTTWMNIGQEVQGASDDLTNAVKQDTANWSGDAADAYRNFAQEQASQYGGIASACQAAGTAVKMCSTLLSVARDIVRDMISQIVGELIAAGLEWVAAEAVSLGIATPGMVADFARIAVKGAKKISQFVTRITEALKRAWNYLNNLGKAGRTLKTGIEKAAGASPTGKDTSIKRPKIGTDGLGTGEVHIDTATTAGNKAIGKAKTDASKMFDGSYVQSSDSDVDKGKRAPDQHSYDETEQSP